MPFIQLSSRTVESEEAAATMKRYEKLGLGDALGRHYDYPWACHELSLILRFAYPKLPKNLQALVFRDTLSAFRLLPEWVSVPLPSKFSELFYVLIPNFLKFIDSFLWPDYIFMDAPWFCFIPLRLIMNFNRMCLVWFMLELFFTKPFQFLRIISE